ncbi:hypothetical protein [Psychrobacter sp. FDAARGOS_221]|uniref:hypothetical protein n=1 Tax=Psychrobacter sp. FDAARGOS_221 TaxID=1975705 RepID=UPI000BB55184|nr:hypothetical protein [Psychrobacter sp. FDAARGOS_221]PNK61486.1 hypothetical protein A6J60_011830 [Psychrobacter sp. FDAARGOS_221]
MLDEYIENIEPAKTAKTGKERSIQDWLRADNRRNALERDIAQMKRHVDTVHLWLRVGVAMLVLVLAMQLMLWFAQ